MKLPSIQKIQLCKHIQYGDYNQIGDEGCHHLSQANWPALSALSLCKHIQYIYDNRIGDQGCYHLSQANWPTLR